MVMIAPPGVYRAQGDTALLIEALDAQPLPPRARVLDIGTGSGAVAVAAAQRGARVTAVDLSWLALGTAVVNAALHGRWIRPRHGDLLRPVRGRRFDVVVANPPYVPAPTPHAPKRGAARAWDAGWDGRLLLDRICAEVPLVLGPKGMVLLVQSCLAQADRTCQALRRAGLRVDLVARARQPFGPVMRARATWFAERHLTSAGQMEEELVVIRGVR